MQRNYSFQSQNCFSEKRLSTSKPFMLQTFFKFYGVSGIQVRYNKLLLHKLSYYFHFMIFGASLRVLDISIESSNLPVCALM